jgi:hypothetical protein
MTREQFQEELLGYLTEKFDELPANEEQPVEGWLCWLEFVTEDFDPEGV